jgi:conjugative relaxase-like TrwC/TraI family protein
VQTTHKIEGSSATSYAEYLTSTSSRADYYTSDGKLDPNLDVPSRWHGSEKVLKELGLSAERTVSTKDLVAVMDGLNPVTSEPLRPAGSNGERVAGIELMLAPPKTVSALWATASPERREQIERAHRQATASALKRTEREVALVRLKTKGVVRFEKAESLLAAELVHTSSRLAKDQERGGIPDPQLHSHVILLAAERKDGKLAAIESKQLYRSARENGAWYRAELAENLKSLGLTLDRRTGIGERYFEVAGVPENLASDWSTRAEDVHRAANLFRERYGREPRAGELGSLTTKTRGSKSAASNVDINGAWRARGAEHGLTKEHAEGLFNDRAIDNKPAVDLREELLKGVNRERSMINDHELKAKAYELSAGVCRPAETDRLIEELARSGELIRLEDRSWTTRHLREIEQATVNIAEQRAGVTVAPVSEQSLKQARREVGREIKGSLTPEQREALDTITGPGGIAVLVGRAGTGKGVVLSAATKAWQKEGNEVIGTAIAGATAMRLQADAKPDRAMTADSLLNGVEKGHIKLSPNTVVIMDEAGMADSDRKARLVKLTAEHGSKFLAAGDAAQLSSIGAGGLFKELEGRVPTAELTEVHRANHEWERDAWEQIREGEPGPALAQYQAHDRLHIHDTRAQATEAMVENWDKSRNSVGAGQAVMITDASNLERDQINAMAQERRAQAGELGAHRIELPDKPYGLASGDEVIFAAQFYPPGEKRVENGITGTITDTSREESQVTIETRESPPREVRVDTSEFNDIGLAYAVHVHKAQGLTAQTSGILTGGWQTDREHTYVAASRARERTDIYLARGDLGEQGLDTGAIERLAERMQRTRAQEASVTKEIAGQAPERTTPEQVTERTQQAEPAPQDPQIRERDLGEMIQEQQERQRDWERGIERDRDDERGFGIE